MIITNADYRTFALPVDLDGANSDHCAGHILLSNTSARGLGMSNHGLARSSNVARHIECRALTSDAWGSACACGARAQAQFARTRTVRQCLVCAVWVDAPVPLKAFAQRFQDNTDRLDQFAFLYSSSRVTAKQNMVSRFTTNPLKVHNRTILTQIRIQPSPVGVFIQT